MKTCFTAALIVCVAAAFTPAGAAEKDKPPHTHYWVTIATQNTSIPGMKQEMSGLQGMLMSKMMPGMGPNRTMMLQLSSPGPVPPSPEATHDIPPVLEMGKTLPLMIPEREKATTRGDDTEPQQKMEKPKVRMLFYWGCGETVRPGQPRVLDTEKMDMMSFGKAMAGRHGSGQTPPSPRTGRAYADWPNQKDSQKVPASGSLVGSHFVHGNYSTDIKFGVDEKHDFMAPVEFTSVNGGLADAIKFDWKAIPTAIGYFALAISHNEKTGETIFWSSSEVPDAGFGLLSYLSPSDVSRFIKEKAVMPPSVTSCTIPKGIYKDTAGAALQFIGYGDELNIAYPPKPKNSTKPHEYIWAMKLRNKSTGMLPLGMGQGQEGRGAREAKPPQEKPAADEQGGGVGDTLKGTFNKLKGLF